MNLINTSILWIWVLGVSLVMPIALPAGGAQRTIIEYSENTISTPLIAFKEFNLLSDVAENSSILSRVKAGTPVRVLKVWGSSEQGKWLLVNVLNQQNFQFFTQRGWVKIGTF